MSTPTSRRASTDECEAGYGRAAVVASDSPLATRPYGALMKTSHDLESTSGPAVAFQAEGGEHVALPSEDDPPPASAFQAESQEHTAPPAD